MPLSLVIAGKYGQKGPDPLITEVGAYRFVLVSHEAQIKNLHIAGRQKVGVHLLKCAFRAQGFQNDMCNLSEIPRILLGYTVRSPSRSAFSQASRELLLLVYLGREGYGHQTS